MTLTRVIRLSASEATILALLFISAAIQCNDGELAKAALAEVTAGLVCCVWGLLSEDRRVRWLVPCAGLVYEIQALLTSLPTVGVADLSLFHVAIWLASGAALTACFLPRQRWRQFALAIAVAGVFAAGVLMLRSAPRPQVDVYDLHQEGSKALFSGSNPYAIRTRDIYSEVYSRKFYGPGVSLGGRLTVGFPYPPVSLFISSLGYLVAGDYRYAHLAAICLTALLLAFAQPGRMSVMAALLFLFCPRVFFVLNAGWSEPTVVFLMGLAVFCRCRVPAAAPWVTGLLLSGKQYMIFTSPALIRRWRDVPKAAIAASIVTAPLVLWNVREFFNSAVFFHFVQPTRPDALSYMAALNHYGIHLPGWVPFLLTAAAMVFVIRLAPSTTTGVCSAASLLMIVFFAFNKSAFCNYYYLVIATLGGAVSTLDAPPVDQRDDATPRIEQLSEIS